MRIGIVNDLRLAVETLKRAVAMLPSATVAWIAEDGAQAVARCAADVPDLVLMDMIMPVMDGVEATRRIMIATPCPILVVTATVEGNATKVFEALGAGALDAVATPGLSSDGGVTNAEPLLRKIRTIAMLGGAGVPRSAEPPAASPVVPASAIGPILAVGASTGGPQALAVVLRALPKPFPQPIVIAQHIDPSFASGLCEWLSQETGHRALPAAEGAALASGVVYLAATADHLILDSSGRIRYTAQPRDAVYRPSVDVFFSSLRSAGAAPGVAVVLTGMGRDGAAGLAALRAAGWFTIAQDKATSVVWGMPGAAAEIGAAARVLPVQSIGAEIAARLAAPLHHARRPL